MKKYNCYHKINNTGFRVVGYSVKGRSKLENQDNYGVYSDNNQLIVIVADGLGSAKLSSEGSKKIVKAAINILSRSDDVPISFPQTLLGEWANGLEGPLIQYDTTVKFVKINDEKIWFGGIGDGWIAINTGSQLIEVTTGSEFTNQTDSILSENLNDKFIINSINSKTVKNVLLSTDGFSEDFEKEKIVPFLEDSYKRISVNPESYLGDICNLLDDWPIKTNLDDKTVIVIQGEYHG